MRKLTLFFTTLFLSVGMAWAQTATLEKSTNVENPEFLYELKNANNVWMASNTAPTQNNIASFAFFGTDNADFYKIYSIDKGQWVSYDKSNNYDNCKDFVKFTNSQDAANSWKITQATRNENAVYQIQPQNSDGSVSDKYMNWNGGVASWGYSYDDTRTVGLWEDNAANDGGSAWILSEKVVSLSDAAEFVNGDIYTFETTRGWMGAKADNDYVVSTVYVGNNIPAADVKRTNPYFQWTVYKSDNDKYYLYNIGKGQFMGVESNNNAAVPFVADPAGLGLTFKKSSDTNYPIMFSTDNKAVVNHSGNHQYGLISWTGGWNTLNDGGSNHKVVKVGVLDETTLSTIEELVANYEETAILKMPEAGKYYRIMAVEGWNDDARYLGSKNYQGMTRAEYVANADAYSIFYFDGNYLKSFASGEYLVSSSDRMLGYNGNQTNGASISFCAASNGLVGAYNIGFNNSSRWLYVNQNNYTDAGGTRNNANGYCFNIVEVTELPVAQIGNTVYYTLTDAKDNVKAGETLTLFVDTDETIELPLGVILDRNGHTADNVTVATPVAQVDGVEYATLAAAVKAASAGATITFVADINGNVTLSKNVTIDGANFNYTGTMSANNALTVTVQNVNFVNGGFSKNSSGTSGTYTIKNCTFDGQGKYAYPVVAKNIGTLNVENCTVKDYQYGFLYVKQQSTKVSVKNVTVENCANYAVYLASGVAATIENLSVKNSNNGILWTSAGARTLNLSGCKFENVKTAINSNGGAYVVTANVQGVNNDFGTAVLSDNVKCVLAEDATLAATTAGLNVTTNVEGKEVVYQGGTYSVAVKRAPAGQVAYRADVTDKTDREGIAILLKDPYAKNSLVVKVYNGNTLMFTCTRRDIDDEGKVMFPVTANTTANIVLWGKVSGSWNNEIHVAPTELNVPDRVEIWADGVLVQDYTHESGTILGTNLEKYLALDCVKKFDAKIGNAGYETLAAAIEAAEAGETIVLLRDVTASDIITINKAITLDGNGKTLTSTAARAFNIETEGKVVINNLTVNAGERAFNIINKAATVELNDVTATANNNAVMIATSAGAANVTINGCNFTGLAVVNVAGAESNVAINNTNITNVDKNKDENYGAITVYSTATKANVTVNGGSITVADDSKQAYIFAEGATVTGVDQIGQIVAMIGEAGYETLTEAIADAKEGQTVKMVDDVTGPGVVINKNTVIDFNGKTYTFTEGVGSTGTPSNGFQILKGNNVTLKNGTLNVAAEAADKFYILVQNYANLTVENMTLDGKYLDKWVATDGDSYVLSNNSGTVNVIGSTIKANDEGSLAFAMDACLKAPYEAPVVTVADGSTVNGNVEVSATLNMNGTLNGNIVINAATGTVNGAAEGLNVITNVADHKVVNNNGAYTIVKKQYVAQVGEQKYETFAAAVAAAKDGQTITLVDNATESATVVLTKNLTIDGDGKTFTGAIEFKKSNGYFTVKNVNFNGAGNRVYALKSQASVTSLTVENCEATGYTYGFLYANKAVANAIVNNVTVKDVSYGVHSAYGTKVTLENYKATNVKYPVYVQNYGTRNVVLNNCSFEGCENPLYIWERNQTNKITFNFKGVNEMGKADFCASAMAVINADAVVGTKVCGTLAKAVEAAVAGDAVTLLRNVELDALLTIDKSITLDLGEYNITRDARTALYVEGDDVEVTINGKGTVSGKQALYVGGGLVKVYGGNFHGLTEAVYVQHSGKAEIYGGKFSSDNVTYVLNEYDSTRETSDITVYGGTFVGFNPADNAAEGQGTNFVAAGLMAVDNGDGTYGVAKANIKMGDSYYATLAEAIAAAQGGEIITLLGNIEEDVTVSKNLTIEGTAGMQYTGVMTLNKVNVTVQNLNFVKGQISKSKNNNGGNVTIVNCNFDGQGMNSYAVNVARTGSVVIENVTAQNYGYGFLQLSHANNKLSIKNVEVQNTNYALKIDYSNGVTIDGLKVEDVKIAAIYNSNYGTKTYTITNSDFSGAVEAIKMWERNTTVYDTFVFAGGNTLGDATLSTSPYAIYKGVVAEVGTKKYLDLRAAFNAAQTGETVRLLEDVALTEADVIVVAGLKTIFHIADKEITFDMNEKKMTVSYEGEGDKDYLYGVFLVDSKLTVTGNGTIDIPQTNRQVAYMFLKRGSEGHLVIENGTFHAGNLEDSMIYTNATNVVTVNGGTFTIDNIGERQNGCPWIFNAKGNNNNSINVYGGTYNTDVNHQYWAFEVNMPTTLAVKANGDGTWTVVPAVASVVEGYQDSERTASYATLADALASKYGNEITLLADATGAGVVINKDATIDFAGYTYTVNKAVGSAGTETLGFQILKDNDVTLKNGTLTSTTPVVEGKEVKMLVQNYANLTLEDMNLVDATDHILYALSNNSGETYLTGNTNITTDAVAFDSYYSKSYDAPEVYVETEGRIEGRIEKNDGATIAISGGTFTAKILPEWCAKYYVPVQNADGSTWTVEKRYIDEKTIVDGAYTEFVNEKEMTVGTLTYERDFTNFSGWQSLFVPFEIPVEQLTTLGYEVAYFFDVHYSETEGGMITENIKSVHFVKITQGRLRANYPYVIKRTSEADPLLSVTLYDAKLYSTAASELNTVESSSTTTRFVFAGTYKKMGRVALTGDDNTPCYRFTPQGQVQKMSATANLVPFRVCMYIKTKDNAPVILDTTNAPEYVQMRVIGESDDETTDIKFYDLDEEQNVDYIYDLQGRRVLEPQKGGLYIVNGKKIVF